MNFKCLLQVFLITQNKSSYSFLLLGSSLKIKTALFFSWLSYNKSCFQLLKYRIHSMKRYMVWFVCNDIFLGDCFKQSVLIHICIIHNSYSDYNQSAITKNKQTRERTVRLKWHIQKWQKHAYKHTQSQRAKDTSRSEWVEGSNDDEGCSLRDQGRTQR